MRNNNETQLIRGKTVKKLFFLKNSIKFPCGSSFSSVISSNISSPSLLLHAALKIQKKMCKKLLDFFRSHSICDSWKLNSIFWSKSFEFLLKSLEFSFNSLWQTFLNFCLLQGPQPPGWHPETSKNSKKSA